MRKGEKQIAKPRRLVARLVPEPAKSTKKMPDFLARMRSIYGDKVLEVSGADLISADRDRY
jgi:hypothetical protein